MRPGEAVKSRQGVLVQLCRTSPQEGVRAMTNRTKIGANVAVGMDAGKQGGGYLPHLDGIRAILLTGILLFHFELFGAAGGYVAVDGFLVLSGFLITRLLWRDMASSSFRFRDFYVRRFWRLYPALVATVFATVVGAYLMQPRDYTQRTCRAVLGSLGFSANFIYLAEDDYFDASATTKPLLHIWSLNLEEQFYLLWPLVLLVIHKRLSRHRTMVLTLICVASAVVAVEFKRQQSALAFFMLPGRIFEFAIGALCAVYMPADEHSDTGGRVDGKVGSLSSKRSPLTGVCQELVASTGIAALVTSFWWLDENDAFPSWKYAAPLLGTAALIVCPSATVSSRVLSLGALQWLGKLSYAAYLTHWGWYVLPMDLFGLLAWGRPPAWFTLTGTLLSALCLQRWVEVPLRTKRKLKGVLAFVGLLGVTLTFASSGLVTNGWQFAEDGVGFESSWSDHGNTTDGNLLSSRTESSNLSRGPEQGDQQLELTSGRKDYLRGRPGRIHNCRDNHKDALGRGAKACFIGRKHARQEDIPVGGFMFGSSYANHFRAALGYLSDRVNRTLVISESANCPLVPQTNVTFWEQAADKKFFSLGQHKYKEQEDRGTLSCRMINRGRWKLLEAYRGQDFGVVVSHRWEGVFHGFYARSKDVNITDYQRLIVHDYFDAIARDLDKLGFRLLIASATPAVKGRVKNVWPACLDLINGEVKARMINDSASTVASEDESAPVVAPLKSTATSSLKFLAGGGGIPLLQFFVEMKRMKANFLPFLSLNAESVPSAIEGLLVEGYEPPCSLDYPVDPRTIAVNEGIKENLPKRRNIQYLDLLEIFCPPELLKKSTCSAALNDDSPVWDRVRLLSTDGAHLTAYSALHVVPFFKQFYFPGTNSVM